MVLSFVIPVGSFGAGSVRELRIEKSGRLLGSFRSCHKGGNWAENAVLGVARGDLPAIELGSFRGRVLPRYLRQSVEDGLHAAAMWMSKSTRRVVTPSGYNTPGVPHAARCQPTGQDQEVAIKDS
jgi:hypothetical protein